MSTNNGGPAFPVLYGQCNEAEGMSLRDYLAAAALTGTLASDAHPSIDLLTLMGTDEKIYQRAEFAYKLADAMLKARAQ